MADTQLKDLTAATSVISTDLLYTVVDPAGTPLDRKITVGNFAAAINGLVDHGTLVGLADDDHAQYASLGGRSGGQTLFGGTAGADSFYIYGSAGASYNRINFNFDAMTVRHSVGIGGDPQNVTNLLQLFSGSEPSSMTADSIGLYSKDFAAGDARLYVFSENSGASTAVVIGNGSIILVANASGGTLYGSAAAAPATLTLRANTDAAQAGYLDLGDSVRLISAASPSQITADQNDYNPGSYVTVVRLTSNASRNITGLAGTGGADGRLLIVHNVGSNDIVLKHESASSSAGARFNLPGASDMTLRPGASAMLRFDNTSSRWRAAAAALWGDALVKAAQVQSTIATGTAPLIVASTTVVTNLNADLLDGQHGSFYQNAGNLNAGTVPTARGGLNTDVSGVAKGGLISGSGSGTFGLLSVGINLQTFTADSASSTGTAWAWSSLPNGYLKGLTLSNNVSDANNDIDIAVGATYDSSAGAMLVLGSSLTKRLDAAWAVGTNQGGLDTGSKATSTGYHVWLIARSDTGVVDTLFSTSATSPTMPANYDRKRRIGWIKTDASGNIRQFKQSGDYFQYKDLTLDANTTTLSTSRTNFTLSVPSGFNILANILCQALNASTGTGVLITSPDQTDVAPNNSAAPLQHHRVDVASAGDYKQFAILTDTSAQIGARASAASTTFRCEVIGWWDRRGQDDY